MNDEDLEHPTREPLDDAPPPRIVPIVASISAATFDAARAVQRYHSDRLTAVPAPSEPAPP